MKKLIKKLLILTIIAAMVVTAMPLTGIDFSDLFTVAKAEISKSDIHKVYGDYIYRVIEGNSTTDPYVYLVKYTGSEKNIVVPEKIEGLTVKQIGRECFSYNGSTTSEHSNNENYIPANPALKEIETVVLPETITSIQTDAFAMCKKLTSVNIPESVRSMGDYVFYGCESLKEITIPGKDITYNDCVFYGSYIEKMNLTEGITKICNEMFYRTKVTDVTLPSSVTSITKGAFQYSRVKSVTVNGTFPRGAVDPYAFMDTSVNKTLEDVYFKYGSSCGSYYDLYDVSYDEDIGYWHFKAIPQTTAATHTDRAFEYYINENGEAVLTKYIGNNPYIEIPKSVGFAGVNLGTVTEIGSGTFTDTAVTKVVISDTVKKIGNKAFYNCNTLETVIIPETVEKIGNYAFFGCKALESITLPDSLKGIGISAFKNCTSLKSLNWPENLKQISTGTFFNCRSLEDFSIFKNVEIIAGGAFRGCVALTIDDFGNTLKEIGEYAFTAVTSSGNGGTPVITATKLPDSLEYLGSEAFRACGTLTEMTIPGSIETIGKDVFVVSSLEKAIISAPLKELGEGMFQETPLKSVVLPDGLEKIGDYAFYCTPLEEIALPDTVNYIGESAFGGCEQLESFDIPPLVTEICDYAFEGCLKFESIVIPSTVKIIGHGAFDWCENLTDITIENGVEEIRDAAFACCGANEITIPESIKKLGKDIISGSAVETVYYNVIDCYRPKINVTLTLDKRAIFDSNTLKKIVFGDKVKSVPYRLAYKSDTLEEVVFSDSIEIIVSRAFEECSALKKVELPKNVKKVNSYTFYNCGALSEVILPEGIEAIGSHSFYGCTALSQINFPSSLESIEYYAFFNCISLEEITIPENLKELNNNAFTNCARVKTLNYNAVNCEFLGLTAVNGNADLYYSPFRKLTSIETINLGENIKELPAYLFCGIKSIREIALPSTVTDVGVGAFAYSEITSFKGSDNLESIEESAFYGCDKLESVEMGNNIMLIGAGAFTGCDKLTEIYIPDTVTNIEMDAFKNCSALHTVRMSPNVDYIPREAFNNCTELSSFTWDAESKLVGRLAFGNCVKLVDFDFLNIEKLYVNSFLGSGVNVVQLGETQNEASRTPLTTVEVQSFMDCDNLATLGVGGNVTTIKTQAFANCENLETAVIADSVTEIADDAFDGCDNLTIYCNKNSYAHSYAQTQGIKVSTLVIAPIANQVYTGFEIKPEVSVSFSGDSLDKNIDFSVSYANNINVGTADVNVKGSGDFRMFASRANFTIVTKNILNADIADIPAQDYTGKAVTPSITVTDGANILREGVDYTVTYSDNIKEGTATAEIKGTGNYSGTLQAKFEIEQMSVFQRIISAITSIFNSIFARIKAFFAGLFM